MPKDIKDEKNNDSSQNDDDFKALLEKNTFKPPQEGELIKGNVITASKSEVKLDIGGIMTGVVRGPELYEEDDEYADLKSGQEVDATVIADENENGEVELSFRIAGQERAWAGLRTAYEDRSIIKVKIIDANKGGLLAKYRQIAGFLPVSQLAPENYPRVSGGDKGKILEKLRSFGGSDFEVKVMTLDEKDDKIIFSEKEAWNDKQKDVIMKYKVGTKVEGKITAITNFGVFISFGENLEGLIHISELAWQRIDDPANLYKVGDMIKAEVISLENSKIFLSAKKLLKDPWHDVDKKYKLGQAIEGIILKVNPFGLFVRLDDDIHGLAHISQLNLSPGERIYDKFKSKVKMNFEVVSMEPKEHRLGLSYSGKNDDKIIKGKNADKEDKEEDKKKDKKKSPPVKASDDKKEEKNDKPNNKNEKKDKKVKNNKKNDKKDKKEGKKELKDKKQGKSEKKEKKDKTTKEK